MEVQTIAEQLLFVTVRIEVDTPQGMGTGTAFVFDYERDGKQYYFLVTNKHVVANARRGRFFFTLKDDNDKPLIGQRHDLWIDDFEAAWHGHPDDDVDIAVMPLVPVLQHIQNQGKAVFFKSVSSELIPTEEQSKDLDAVEDVLFVGYPSGIYDAKNLLPIIRRGTTASPFLIDYEGQSIFLIDASVFPGSSGSPVFILDAGSYRDKSGNIYLGQPRFLFLGVVAEVLIRPETGRIEFRPIPTAQEPIVTVAQMIDLGVVYKSSAVVAAILDLLKARGQR